jgi:hypothetical protein
MAGTRIRRNIDAFEPVYAVCISYKRQSAKQAVSFNDRIKTKLLEETKASYRAKSCLPIQAYANCISLVML